MAEPYYIAMDSYPQEEKKFNKLYKFFEHFRKEGLLLLSVKNVAGWHGHQELFVLIVSLIIWSGSILAI